MFVRILFTFLLFFIFSTTYAKNLQPDEIPAPLQPWVKWVLQDALSYNCPYFYNQAQQKCHIPSNLAMKVGANDAEFTQTWQMYREGWVALPGSQNPPYNLFPEAVFLNDKPALVVEHEGEPSVFLPEGSFILRGKFTWQTRPEAIVIPKNTGSIQLSLDGVPIAIPEVDEKSLLWLRQQGQSSESNSTEKEHLALRIYRQLQDGIPFQINTRIELEVAGKSREIFLGAVLWDKQIPVSVESPLPTHLEADGRLRIQVRTGTWVINVQARLPAPVSVLQLPPPSSTGVEEEIWSFVAQHELRSVDISGVPAIDPQQTSLPEEWRKYPAYLVHVGDKVELLEKRRGDSAPPPDQLSLQRNFWLDFDGQGYSVQDQITGTMSNGWRLDLSKPAQLGRASVNGQHQLITKLANDKEQGIELRRGQVQVDADSRLEEAVNELPSVGWKHDFQSVSAQLHLPPGWRLFHAEAVDSATETWLQRWTLLDLFAVLIVGVAIGKLYGGLWGALALLTLTLTFHENDAPQWIWINLLFAFALLRVLPRLGRLAAWVTTYRNISLLIWLLITLPFVVQQVRQSLYPQLEKQFVSIGGNPQPIAKPAPAKPESKVATEEAVQMQQQVPSPAPMEAENAPAAPPAPPMMPSQFYDLPSSRDIFSSRGSSANSMSGVVYPNSKAQRKKLVEIDPNAQVQTGKGMPQWHWRAIQLHWQGPVRQDEQLKLWLISPFWNAVLGIGQSLLLLILSAFFLVQAFGKIQLSPLRFSANLSGMLILVALSALSLPQPSFAEEFPPQPLLDKLQQRLLAPLECLPSCASIAEMHATLNAKELRIRLQVHSQQRVFIPLPSHAQQWVAQQVLLNGETAKTLWREQTGQLWLGVEQGIHEVVLQGALPNHQSFTLSLPLKPLHVSVEAKEWRVDGLQSWQRVENQLQFTREQGKEAAQELSIGSLPPLLQVERTLSLGLEWQIETKVTRLSPSGSAVVLDIPLLAGESVTQEDAQVHEGKVQVNLAPQQQEMSWSSVLTKQTQLQLTAPESLNTVEVWRLDISPIWHVELSGIPMIHQQNSEGRWLPEWRPWAGEKVELKITRPEAVAGQVTTLDRSELHLNYGLRTTDSRLLVNLRSSRGGQHAITLPSDAQVQSVKINQQSIPLRQEGQKVVLPLVPGSQQAEIVFRQATGIQNYTQTPVVDLGMDSVNSHLYLNTPRERWILAVGGSGIGAAVFFWGVLAVMIVLALALGRTNITPLKTRHWLLLCLVLTQIPISYALCVIGWFFALGVRAQLKAEDFRPWKFNFIQLGLLGLSFFALVGLVWAIEKGLLGQPRMFISGNGSHGNFLHWYQDRIGAQLPQSWVISIPLYYYRIFMLAWALWLATAMLRWLPWAWRCFSAQLLWKRSVRKKGVVTASHEPT